MDKEALKKRTKDFALRILRLSDNLPKTASGKTIGIVVEESDETMFWLELIRPIPLIIDTRRHAELVSASPMKTAMHEILKQVQDDVFYGSVISGIGIRPLRKTVLGDEMEGVTERSTGVYSDVHEDTSTGVTEQFAPKTVFRRGLVFCTTAKKSKTNHKSRTGGPDG